MPSTQSSTILTYLIIFHYFPNNAATVTHSCYEDFFLFKGSFKYPVLHYGHPSAKTWMFPPGVYHSFLFNCEASPALSSSLVTSPPLQPLSHSAALHSRPRRGGKLWGSLFCSYSNLLPQPILAIASLWDFLLPGKQDSHKAKSPSLFGGMSVSQSFKNSVMKPQIGTLPLL